MCQNELDYVGFMSYLLQYSFVQIYIMWMCVGMHMYVQTQN